MLLTPQYTAPLPPGFQSGTLELRSQTTYIDKDGRAGQPYYLARINADRSLTNLQNNQPLQIVGMGQGDPATASQLDVIETMVVSGLPSPLRPNRRVFNLDTGGGYLNLHLPAISVPVVGPPDQTLTQLIATAQQQVAQVSDNLDVLSFGLTLIPPAVLEAQQAAAAARVVLGGQFVKNQAERSAYLAALPGDGLAVQLDTHEVWRKQAGLIEMIGLNSLTPTGPGPVEVLLYHNSTLNADLRSVYPDKVLSIIQFDDSTVHGFPTTKGTLRTDRTGWVLTGFGQLSFDIQTWHEYGGLRTWERAAQLDGTWGAWQRTDAASALGTPSIVILGNNTVTAATLRGGFPDKVKSTCACDNSTAHGFPTTKGTLVTDRTGWTLTQFQQLRFDTQVWTDYDTSATWQRRANLDGTWSAWDRTDAGGVTTNAPAVNALITAAQATLPGVYPRLSGGTPGNFVFAVASGYADAHPSMLRELKVKRLLHLGLDNVIRAAGLTGGFQRLRTGETIWLTGGPAGGANWKTYPVGADPVAAIGFAPVACGTVASATEIAIAPLAAATVENAPVALPDDLSGYSANGSVAAAFTEIWGAGLYLSPTTFSSADFDSGRIIQAYSHDDDTAYCLAKTSVPPVVNDKITVQLRHDGNSQPSYVFLRAQGTKDTATAVYVKFDQNYHFFYLGYIKGGFETDIRQQAISVTQQDVVNIEFAAVGTRLVCRVWLRGQAAPAWQMDVQQEAVMTAGYPGVGARRGAVNFGQVDLVRNSGFDIPPVLAKAPNYAVSSYPQSPGTALGFDRYLLGDSLSNTAQYQALNSNPPSTFAYQNAISGQQSYAIAGRVGGIPAYFKFPGDVIPGGVGDVLINKVSGPDFIGDNAGDQYMYASFKGVYGTVKRTYQGQYSFRRAAAGQAVAVSATEPAMIDVSAIRGRTVIIWAGVNDIADANYSDYTEANNFTLQNIRAAYNAAVAAGGYPVVLGILNRDLDGWRKNDANPVNYNKVISLNSALAAMFGPAHFYDIRAAMATGAADIIPAAYRYDDLHLNTVGYPVMMPLVNTYLASIGRD